MRIVALAVLVATSTIATLGSAGVIGVENARPGNKHWDARRFGNAQADGVIDLYPAAWSIARGETVRLKVRSTAAWSLHVYRVGWYGGDGAREVYSTGERGADPQPYPSGSDPSTGLVAAGWRDSVSFPTDATFAPGLYVARADHASGKQAMTFFVVRDDGLSPRMPILVSVTTSTHQAYNAWPGASRGGKSLYGFNSSASRPSQSGSNQAVKVSYDRPYLVGGGSADVLRYEVPFLRWAERNGWDVAWCTDEDLARDPSLASGRRVFAISGHWEYLSKGTYDAVEQARDNGTNLLVLSGDTIAWQIRLEDGGRTAVGYKESWPNDPEHRAGMDAAIAGKLEEARAHFRVVTRGWKNMGYFPEYGIDERRPALRFLGVQSAGAMGPEGPWGDLVIEAADHWLFAGTGLKDGDRIGRVMGYEYDSLYEGEPWPFPPGRVKLGKNVHPRTHEEVGGAAYYKHSSGAEVVALGAVNFAYALDGFASPWKSEDERAQKMIDNALRRWTVGAPTPAPLPEDAGATASEVLDGGVAAPPPLATDASVVEEAGGAAVVEVDEDGPTSSDAGSCSAGRGERWFAAFAMTLALALMVRRRASAGE